MSSKPNFKVVDFHVHITDFRMVKPHIQDVFKKFQNFSFDFLLNLMKNPSKFVEFLDENWVEKVCLINYVSPDVMGFTWEVNNFVSNYCKSFPDRLIAFGSVHPRFTKNPKEEMETLYSKLEVKGIKLHPPHQLFYPNEYSDGKLENLKIIYKMAEQYGLPVMVHTGTSIFPGARIKYGNPLSLDDVAVDFPNLKIIMAHGGRPIWMKEAFYLLRRHQNIYLDISSIPPKKLLEYFPRLNEIAEKTVFGSDWPGPMVKSIKANIQDFLSLPLPNEAKRKILRENALKILKI
ncbi:amidohydrolase [Candidatus Bathyarchaeota archaeon]|nr:MAG: amidohydrolase [Candidatus Bathyarchaeota archaeon]